MKLAALWALILILLVFATIVTLEPMRAGSSPVRGAAQVSVDGVPVCVFSHAGQIIAGVGRCGIEVPVPPAGVTPSEEPEPGMRLPPGHPPIEGGKPLEEPKRVLI